MDHLSEQWADNVLAAADNIKQAKAPSHFYTQTLARIKAEAGVSRTYVLRIAAGLLLLVALNVFACVSFSNNNGQPKNKALQAFAMEYGITPGGDLF